MSAYPHAAAVWTPAPSSEARHIAAERKREAEAAAAYASAEPEATHITLLIRDLIGYLGEIDERDCIVMLKPLADKLAGQINLPPGLCDLVQELRGYCVALDGEFRERMA